MTNVDVVKSSVVEADLTPWEIPAKDVVSGTPESSVGILWHNEERTLGVGIWHCTPGAFYLDHEDETVVLVEGEATVTPEGGTPTDLRPGDIAFFPGGNRVLWEVRQTIRKGFHVHDPSAKALAEA